jgi:hypothetical protein
MINRSKLVTLALLLVASVCGCRGPTELFSFIDRNCFIADWTNDHSCLSCRYTANAGSVPTISKVRDPIPAPLESIDEDPALPDTGGVTASDLPADDQGRL